MQRKAVWYLAAGAGAGALAGFLGIGGGVILVPMMTGFLYLNQHRAHGTSLAIIIPIAIVGALIYVLRGDVEWEWVATIGAGSIAGAVVGAKLMMRVPAYRLRQLFGVYTIAIAAILFLR
jgi:uncharacterized membrane protein YfcA